MTIQKEAEDLINEFFHLNSPKMDDIDAFMSWSLAKQCALLHLDKVIKMDCLTDEWWLNVPKEYKVQYWKQLKEAVENL